MGFGWHSIFASTGEKPRVTWPLLRRVMGYAWPYRWLLAGMLLAILASTGLGLLRPLILRDLIDRTPPATASAEGAQFNGRPSPTTMLPASISLHWP